METVDRHLHLTSPHIRGEDVRLAQRRLDGKANSIFRSFHPGDVDGEYGEKTAAATRRAKYWLGYQNGDLNGNYGPTLDAYITGRKKLTIGMRARRHYRMQRAADREAAKPLRVKVYETAKSQIGVEESPAGSNRVKYSDWYGMVGPWCAMFCSWCSDKVGGKFHYAYTPYVVRDARAGVNAMRVVSASEVRQGDFVLYDWERNGVADHIGVFEGWVSKYRTFTAIEGNTSVTSDDNGGKVMRRSRDVSLVICFVRVER